MLCMYHLDDDGKCAAAVVRLLGRKDQYQDKFVEMNYGREVPFDKVNPDEIVYIVDFSIEKLEDMHKLLEITPNVIWIDHHFTAIEKYEDFPRKIDGVRCTDCSGCMLTYLYLTDSLDLCEKAASGHMKMEVPYIVQYCDDYDMWRFNKRCTKEFHAGFDLVPHDPECTIWDDMIQNPVCSDKMINRFIDEGRIALNARAKLMKDCIKSCGYESIFEGKLCFVFNQSLISSDDFESVDGSKYDMFVGMSFNGERWSYSLRAAQDEVDVGSIAKKYGGGGHKGAAGFSNDQMLFLKLKH